MSDTGRQRATEHWDRDGLVATVLLALNVAGLDIDHLDVDDLAAIDQFHGGGLPVTIRLAELAGLAQREGGSRSRRVLDVGGGLGGPARTLAAHYGCVVTALDLTRSYVEVAAELTRRVGLADRVTHLVGDALDLPFDDGSFDIVWTQNSGMNIADKRRLYAGFHRVLRPGGTLAFQEPMAGELQPLHYPVMWADTASTSHLVPPDEIRAILEALGFAVREWNPVTDAPTSAPGNPPPHAVQQIIMGPERAAVMAASSRANLLEGRMVSLHATLIKL